MKDLMDKIGFWGQLGLAFVGSVVLAIVLSYYVYPPYPVVKAEIEKMESQRNDLKSQISQAKSVQAKLAEFKAEIKRLEERLETFLDILPGEKDTDSLLRKVHNLAEETNVDIRKFGKAKLVKKEMFSEYIIKVNLQGSYHNLAMFFDKLRNIERIMYVSALQMKSAKSKDDPALTIKGSCELKTFIMKAKKGEE